MGARYLALGVLLGVVCAVIVAFVLLRTGVGGVTDCTVTALGKTQPCSAPVGDGPG